MIKAKRVTVMYCLGLAQGANTEAECEDRHATAKLEERRHVF